MNLFSIPMKTKQDDFVSAKKVMDTPVSAQVKIAGSESLLQRIASIRELMERYLGNRKNEFMVIDNANLLTEYLDKIIENGIVAIDTETEGLDVYLNPIAGICLYTPGMPSAYIPLNHVSYVTNVKLKNQLPIEYVALELKRIKDVKKIYHNSVFDIRVLKRLGIHFDAHWDTYIGARLLNENEKDNSLKGLYEKYILKGSDDTFKFNELFGGIPFTLIPISVGYMYAAYDPKITFELYEFQKQYLTEASPLCKKNHLEKVAWVMNNVEMPLVKVVVEMEENGCHIDDDFAEYLKKKYNTIEHGLYEEYKELFVEYKDRIEDYISYKEARYENPKIEYPPEPNSPDQLSTFFYDILQLKPINRKKPRSTAKDILQAMDNPISKKILEIRGVRKLLSTYIEKLPEIARLHEGIVHGKFNQLGTDTGRFSSNDPNLQNIPSKNKEIRKMFIPAKGNMFVGCDFSGQEMRLVACISNDPKLIQAYMEGKDVYCVVASIAFGVPYEECLETLPDGREYPKGKERRGKAKAICLGIIYGKGVKSISEDLNVSKTIAQEIYDAVLKNFPDLAKYLEDVLVFARKHGYVETYWGRKRRLPDINLPTFSFSPMSSYQNADGSTTIDDKTKEYFFTRLIKAREDWNFKKVKELTYEARTMGILVFDNSEAIAKAERQAYNSPIQGSAGDLTKLAMIRLSNNKRAQEIGVKLVFQVHDELIVEAPEENIIEVGEILRESMMGAGEGLQVPLICDEEYSYGWYHDSYYVKDGVLVKKEKKV